MKSGNVLAQYVVVIIGNQSKAAIPIHKIAVVGFG